MAQFAEEIPVAAERARVWRYVKEVDNWATLFPGHQRHLLVEDDHYFWQLRGEAGIWSRMVDLDVYVTEWSEPDDVVFRFTSRTEPVEGTGRFYARAGQDAGSVMGFELDVRATGTAAPMINALLKRAVPELSGPFLAALGEQLVLDGGGDGVGATVRDTPAIPAGTRGCVVVDYRAPRTEGFERWWQDERAAALRQDAAVLRLDRYELLSNGGEADYRELIETTDLAATLALAGRADDAPDGFGLLRPPAPARRVGGWSPSPWRRLSARLTRARLRPTAGG